MLSGCTPTDSAPPTTPSPAAPSPAFPSAASGTPTGAPSGRPTVEAAPLRDAPFCTPPPDGPPLGRLRLQVWHSEGVPGKVAAEVGEAAVAVWRRLGVATEASVVGTVRGKGLIDEGPSGPDLSPMKAVLAQLPTRAGMNTLHLVAMERFVEADGAAAQSGIAFRGLTLSPWLPDDPTGLLARLALEQDPVPTIFIDLSAGPRAPGDLSLTPAHEVGHALGLPHQDRGRMLMSPGLLSLRCIPGLDETERITVQRRLGAR